MADLLERYVDRKTHILIQKEHLTAKIKNLPEGGDVHPKVIEYFVTAAKSDEFWLDITSTKLDEILLNMFNRENIYLDLKDLNSVTNIFRFFIDFRTPYTASHSTGGVAACASQLARYFAFSENEILLMEVAGSLHDIGKLTVPNEILEKPSALTVDEFAVIKQHTYYTYQILSQVTGFEKFIDWAAHHHECLDGTGYPFALKEEEISLGAKIFAVSDVFTALKEDRPYRPAMTDKEAIEIINNMVASRHLDGNIVKVLLDNIDEVNETLSIRKKRSY